jgi:hypothetical protein
MTSRQKLQASLNHKSTGGITVDFGATSVTGIHVLAIERLRQHYGLEKRPVKVSEPYQMLGQIDDDLADALGCDVKGVYPRNNMFGFENKNWKEFKTFWGQVVLVPEMFNSEFDANGDLLMFPEGDRSVKPSAKMPKSSFFFDALDRHQPYDESNPSLEDNMEEFGLLSETDIAYWKSKAPEIKNSDKGVLVNVGGTALGDIALVPGTWMKNPKGIRDISDWYMSTLMRMDFVQEIFDKQTEIAIKNLETLYGIIGNTADAIFICGTDFGTQNSQFCSPEIFSELYTPYYKKMNNWIHSHTTWKTFKHSCGAILPLIPNFIEAGFDIINPVQINATDMDSNVLKKEFGDKITFWGGGVDTQMVLSFGSPADVQKQVTQQCEILGKDGGFVFNTVHNTQANVPVENMVAMIDAVSKFNDFEN